MKLGSTVREYLAYKQGIASALPNAQDWWNF
jgi:hypothetical protein